MTASKPAEPLALPEVVRAWARGRCDRVLRARADGSVTLTMLLPGETLEAHFLSAGEAARALATEVKWQLVLPLPVGRNFGRQRAKPI